jgi:hypothetical protein
MSVIQIVGLVVVAGLIASLVVMRTRRGPSS